MFILTTILERGAGCIGVILGMCASPGKKMANMPGLRVRDGAEAGAEKSV